MRPSSTRAVVVATRRDLVVIAIKARRLRATGDTLSVVTSTTIFPSATATALLASRSLPPIDPSGCLRSSSSKQPRHH